MTEQKLLLTLTMEDALSWADVPDVTAEDMLMAWHGAIAALGVVDYIAAIPIARARLEQIVEIRRSRSMQVEATAKVHSASLSVIPRERIELAAQNRCGGKPTRREIAQELLRVLDLLAKEYAGKSAESAGDREAP